MAVSGETPIIIKRIKKGGHAGHHGGAWKVAYADFVTAMMAFFLVMWLVASVSKQERAAIFEYFKNPSMENGKSVHPAPGMNGPGGASMSPINLGGGLDAPPTRRRHGARDPPGDRSGGGDPGSGPASGERRSSRGGSWRHHIKVTRCAARSSIPPQFQYADYGFRVACDCR